MDNQREKERDRSRRGDRPSRFSDATRDRSNERSDRSDGKRLFVSNIPYEFRWTELKDLFKEKVGDVAYVELFNDENGKPRGCGVVEFTNSEAMKKALFVMHRYELNGRKLVLKEETGNERNRLTTSRSGGGGGGGGGSRNTKDDRDGWGVNKPREPENFNTYGLSLQFLESINVQPPLVKKVFVANLDYKADRNKIKEVFKMAGKVRNIDLAVDKDGNSRGFAVIEYDHPVEAVQAISMFDKQTLYERRMTVRMDRGTDKAELRMPDGLKGIGLGLGPNGEPLRDVARNLPQPQTQNNLNLTSTGSTLGTSVLGAVPAAGVTLNGLGTGLSANTLNTNTALGGGLGLQALGLTGLGALQNQLLQQGLTASDLATMLTAQAQVANVNNAATLSLANADLTSNVLGNSGLSNNVLGGNSSMSSGPLSASRQMGGMSSVSNQGYSRESSVQHQQSNRDKPSDIVVITNLPPTVTWQLIREKFSECGDVKFAEMTAPDTAIVRFHKEWDAERAIKMFDRTRIDGRTIDVRFF
ncbi:heterogeneous nuclear ribonucleoprotein M [Pectinophora gossypiella]|uniref:RRM domain-containing protein n=1 Tax=Pectinophora gossypiella TaxID=13191 RepID=A0A1E1WAV5_PECGO|nr:heterogeneous nuclear ribonucleoprotein M [Pectinophora gossypiella]XP_049872203.1 heterogeneous nuclear ribonucleoprotein M [Pectinophora gossypiella]